MSANPNTSDRTFTAVLTSIFGNVQEIVRSEVKLAKAEVREEIAGCMQGAAWLATGALSAFFAVSFLLVAVFFALSRSVPQWAAALIIAGALLIITGISIAVRGSLVKTTNTPQIDLTETKPEEGIA